MRPFRLFLLILLLGWSAAAAATVEIHFYSKDFASTFPHAYVRLTGTVESTGEQIDINYGFTPVRITPALLLGPVRGMIQTVEPDYVARSDRHFSLPLTEAQYQTVMATVERWRSAKQPNYRLNSRNCVYFVADVAAALGLAAPPAPKLMKKPRSFLEKVTLENSEMIRGWPGSSLPSAPAPIAAPAGASSTPR